MKDRNQITIPITRTDLRLPPPWLDAQPSCRLPSGAPGGSPRLQGGGGGGVGVSAGPDHCWKHQEPSHLQSYVTAPSTGALLLWLLRQPQWHANWDSMRGYHGDVLCSTLQRPLGHRQRVRVWADSPEWSSLEMSDRVSRFSSLNCPGLRLKRTPGQWVTLDQLMLRPPHLLPHQGKQKLPAAVEAPKAELLELLVVSQSQREALLASMEQSQLLPTFNPLLFWKGTDVFD